jgi:DNA mismatch repair protein MutS
MKFFKSPKIAFFVLIVSFFFFYEGKLLGDEYAEKDISQSLYYKVAKLSLPSLADDELEENNLIEKTKNLNRELKKKLQFDKIGSIELGDVEKLRLGYNILAQHDIDQKDFSELNLFANIDTFNDLNFFCGRNQEPVNHIFQILDKTKTTFGKIELQKTLLNITDDVNTLKNRQILIKTLVDNPQLLKTLNQNLSSIASVENSFLSLWRNQDFFELYNQMFYDGALIESFNTNRWIKELNARGMVEMNFLNVFIALGSCIIIAAVSYIKGKHSIEHGQRVGGYAIFGIGALYSCFLLYGAKIIHSMATMIDNLLNNIQQITINTSTYLSSINNIGKELSESQVFNNFFSKKDLEIIANIENNLTKKTEKLYSWLKSNTFKGIPSMLSWRGKVLAAFKLLQETKESLVEFMKIAGKIDVIVSVAKLYKKFAHKENTQFCFVEYIENSPTPIIDIHEYWHPILNPNIVITNNIQLGTTNNHRNGIITGPNQGGKSTNLKSIIISVLLAQTIGIAPAKRLCITPFSNINCSLNIADTTGKESLYEAEMHRALALLKKLKSLNNNQFSFVIFDELFTGTNPEEGEAGSYGVAKNLIELPNNICLLATHFKKLTQLEERTNGACKNYKVYIEKGPDNSFTFPYKLVEGISHQNIALDLLKKEGFDTAILNDAYSALNEK